MAAAENQALMVLQEEGAAAPAAAAPSTSTPMAFFVILKPGHASEGGRDQGILVSNQEANSATTSAQAAAPAGVTPHTPSQPSVTSAATSNTQPENLPPQSTCKGVKVTLDNNNMWNEFYRCKTEMILTKQGRRMFPYCRFRISGMEPFQRYILVMDITPMDNYRYKWSGRQWEMNGKAEPHVLGRVFIHPESPSLGHYWMQNPISFYKLKLTNNTLDQEGHVILHSMHRYLPRLHVVPADKATEVIQLNGPDVMTFTFPQTEFFAVTAYQNLRITQLKIDYNPFAKGFREEGPGNRPKPESSGAIAEIPASTAVGEEARPLKTTLKSLLGKGDTFDSFVIDRELFHTKDYDIDFLDNGMPTAKAKFTDEELGGKKRVWAPGSMEEALVKVRRRVPETGAVVVKEEPGESEAGKAVPQQSALQPKRAEPVPLPQLAVFLQQRRATLKPIAPKPGSVSLSPPAPAPEPSHAAKPSSPAPDGPEASGSLEEPGSRGGLKAGPAAASALQAASQLSPGKKKRKSTFRYRRHGRFVKRSAVETPAAVGGPTDVTMQPNLEDVEGLLFVSFTSKEALEVHLGDQPLNREVSPQPQDQPEPPEETVPETMQEKITRLEEVLLQDLKHVKHRQVIHPVLQEVGLKLNLLDPTLAIDLQYLGVCLPLPPPSFCPGDDACSGVVTSSPDGAVAFVSRTGKTTDFTKIKGWRDKFNVTADTSSSKPEGGVGADGALKNRSAFCSDMLDEYLANEGKLIDERAASFTQSAVSPVVYQLPTKSTSYVRTLDSVLKKKVPSSPTPGFPLKPLTPPKKPRSSSRTKAPARPKHAASQAKAKVALTPEATHVSAAAPSPATAAPLADLVSHSIPTSYSAKPAAKTKVASKSPRPPLPTKVKLQAESAFHAAAPLHGAQARALPGAIPDKVHMWQDSNLVGQGPTGASPRNMGLSKMLVKLMDLEDGAVWEGKSRTCITEERAEIALAALLTAQGTLKANRTVNRVVRRRAPPCLNDFCRLGCVCSSLALERRKPTHCGKPECMFGCTCLKRKVVLIRAPHRKKRHEDLIFYGALPEDTPSKPKKKKKRRASYTAISEPEQEQDSEPAARVQILWNPKKGETDLEPLYVPTPLRFPSLPPPAPVFTQPKVVPEEDKDPVYLYFESMMTCARVRPYNNRSQTAVQEDDPFLNTLETLAVSGKAAVKHQSNTSRSEASKRLEIMSECKWEKKSDRNQVLRVVCEHMAQNRLSQPFRVGSYLVRPLSQTYRKEGQGRTIWYKVCISQALGDGGQERGRETEESPPEAANRAESGALEEAAAADRPRRKVLPFFTHISPAGILTANKKQPGVPAQGLIKVNGKCYPQAKLQLGQMGALHPANRLAAYITGRLRSTSKEGSTMVSAIAKSFKIRPSGDSADSASTQPPTTSVAAVTTSIITSTPKITTVLKHVVTKPAVGKVFTQFVVNKIGSLPHKLPTVSAPQLLGGVQKISLSSAPLLVVSPSLPQQGTRGGAGATATGVALSAPPLGGVNVLVTASSNSRNALPTSSGTEGKTAASTSPGGTASGPRMLLIPVPPSAPATRPACSAPAPLSPGHRMVLQPVRSTSGTTLFRHPNGQLVHLVPISQLRTVQPNLVIRNPGNVVQLPTPVKVASGLQSPVTSTTTPVLNKSPGSSASVTPVTSPDAGQKSPVSSTSPGAMTTDAKVTTSPGPKAASLLSASAFNLGDLSPSLKPLPGFLGQTGTYTVRISPVSGGKESKLIALNPVGPTPVSPEILSIPGGFTLLQIPKSPVAKKPAVSGVLISQGITDPTSDAPPAKADPETHPPLQEGTSVPREVTPAGAVCSDHSYTSGRDPLEEEPSLQEGPAGRADLKPGVQPTQAPGGLLGGGPKTLQVAKRPTAVAAAPASPQLSPTRAPTQDRSLKAPVHADGEPWSTTASGASKGGRFLEEGEVEVALDLDVTADSDDVTEDSEEDSEDDGVNANSESVASEEEAVDIETVEELVEKINIARMKAVAIQMKLDKVRQMQEAKKTTEFRIRGRSSRRRAPPPQPPPVKPQDPVNLVAGRMQHNVTERRRRSELRELFEKLRHVLGLEHLPKASKFYILKQANNEIQALVDQNDSLEERKKMLNRQRAAYIRKISQTFGKTEELIIKTLQDICTKQKVLEAQKKKKAGAPTEEPPPRLPPQPSAGPARNQSSPQPPPQKPPRLAPQPVTDSLAPSRSPRGRPNILSRKKPSAPATEVLPGPLLCVGALVPNRQILSMKSPLQRVATLMQPSKRPIGPSIPGVASVTISVPRITIPLKGGSPTVEMPPSRSSQATSTPNTSKEARKPISMPKIISVTSLVASTLKVENEDQSVSTWPEATWSPADSQDPGGEPDGEPEKSSLEGTLEDGEVLGDQLTCDGPRDAAENPEAKGVGVVSSQEEEDEDDEDDDDEDPEDETLTLLLNEIAFLNQQISSDSSGTPAVAQARFAQHSLQEALREEEATSPIEEEEEEEEEKMEEEEEEDHRGDDERSLSPLFLQLDEDLLGPKQSSVEEEEPALDDKDPVNRVLGPGMKLEPEGSEVTVANGFGQQSPPGSVKGGALTPPPLLQMKAGSVAASVDAKAKGGESDGEVSWRPMPRLAPLGLKSSHPPQEGAAASDKAPSGPLNQSGDDPKACS